MTVSKKRVAKWAANRQVADTIIVEQRDDLSAAKAAIVQVKEDLSDARVTISDQRSYIGKLEGEKEDCEKEGKKKDAKLDRWRPWQFIGKVTVAVVTVGVAVVTVLVVKEAVVP